MIPRLFEKTETTFTNYGICALYDALSCAVTEERNGEYVLDMTYPRNGDWINDIAVDRIILAIPNDTATEGEPFRISSIDFDMIGDLTIHAQHISYQLNSIIIGKNQQDPGTRYPAKFWEVENRYLLSGSNPFTFATDISDAAGTVYKYGCDYPTPLRTLLGGMENSMLDIWDGEFYWNRYAVNFLSARGADHGVKIAYSKNLTGLRYSIDMSEVYSGVVAYWMGVDETGADIYVQSTLQTVNRGYSYSRDIAVDATAEFEETPTVAQLNAWALAYVQTNAPDPVVSVDVNFVPLWQTEEYKEFYALEHVSLCDTVEVLYPPLGLDVKAKVVKTVYDVLTNRYTALTISTIKPTLADTIFALMKEVEK